MIFEVRKGRSCDSIKSVQSDLIEVQGRELVATGKALELSESKNETAGLMIDNLKDQVGIERELAVNQQKQNKQKLKKWKLATVIQTAVIIILIL